MKIEKILLIAPPAFTMRAWRDINPLPPMGLGYLASVAEKSGINVKIVDCLMQGWDHEEDEDEHLLRVGLPDERIREIIREFKPDMVGINCQFSRQYRIYHQMFELVKGVDPHIVVVAGGPHASVCPEEVLADANCDYLLVGEAEESFRELYEALQNDSDVGAIDGLGWKVGGQLRINPKLKLIMNLDSISFPAYHLMELDKYFGLEASHGTRHKSRFSAIITSRGCPAKCTFCSAHQVWGKKYRMRSVENVLEEMRLLKETYGIEELLFEDDNVTADARRAKLLFSRMIEEEFNFVWDTPNGAGVWSMDEEMIDLMKKSGCVKLNFPVESGSQRVLDKIIRKPLDLGKVKRLIQHCQKIGLEHSMFLVMGMPGETIDDMWKSFRFAAECGCFTPHISVATPYPGTQLYDDCVRNGYFFKPFSLDDLFIRSYLIRTPEWDENDLKKMLFKGMLYIEFRNALANPARTLKRIVRLIFQPTRGINFVKSIFNKS
ncbi:MAG: B12-binding domain-containing radical SAM protein [Deltaproteobacteria bacterium]|nr:B12-binding domain-containing radical SAM protein [Deltaproteobacteria bacterium]